MPEGYGAPQIIPLLEKTKVNDMILFDDRSIPLRVVKGPTSPRGTDGKFITVVSNRGTEYDIVWNTGPDDPRIPDRGPIHYFENQTMYDRRAPSDSHFDPEFDFGGL